MPKIWGQKLAFKDRLHVPFLFPCPSPSSSKFIIVAMVLGHLTERLDLEQIPSVNVNWTMTVTETDRDGTCKWTFNQ